MISGGKREKNNPFFTIITVVFNGETTLEDTINSLLSQNTDDYEYIIVDGESKDNTLQLIRKYEEHINYWQSETDHGIYDAMNKGVSLAKGKWLYFLNAGDVFENESVLSNIKNELENSDADLLYGIACTKDKQLLYHPEKISRLMFLLERMICHQTIFATKKCFENNLFNTDYKIISDRIWLYNCYKKIKIYTSNVIVSKYDMSGISSNQSRFDQESLAFTKSISLLGYILGKTKRLLKR